MPWERIRLWGISVMERSKVLAGLLLLAIPISAQQGIISTRMVGGSVPVAQGQPILSISCTTSLVLCVTPTSSSIFASAGLSLDAGNPGDLVNIVTYGRGPGLFDNTPIQGNIAIIINDKLHDSGLTDLSTIPNTQLISGKILQVTGPNTALTNFLGPGRAGDVIEVPTIDQGQLTTYIQTHQLTSTGPTGATGATGATGNTG